MENRRERLPLLVVMGVAASVAASSSVLPAPCAPLTPGTFAHGTRDLTQLQSGTPVEATVRPLPAGIEAQIMLDSQFAIDAPAGAESLLFVLEAADAPGDNFDFAVRFGAPVEIVATTPVADYWVMFPTGYEELGLWGDELAAGRYYVAIITRSPTGGKLTITATINGALVDAAPDTRTSLVVPAGIAGTAPARRLDGQQYRCRTPADAQSLLVELHATSLDVNASFALRPGAPVDITPDGVLIASHQVDARGGYGAVCLSASVFNQSHIVYVWVLNAAEEPMNAELDAALNGCTRILDRTTSFEGFVPQVPPLAPAGAVVLAETQYVINAEAAEARKCLHIDVENIDQGEPLRVYFRKGTPIGFLSTGGTSAPVFDQQFALGPGVTRLLIKPLCINGQPLYVAIGNSGPGVRAYTVDLLTADCPFAYGRHPFRRGDSNSDAKQDIGDAIHILGYLFSGVKPMAPCMDAFDANDDGKVEIADAIAMLQYLFGSRLPLPAPLNACGQDPTADSLTCEDCRSCMPCITNPSIGTP